MPVFVLVVLGLTLIGFAVTSLLGFSPAWAALAGAVVLGVRALARRETIARIASAADVPFLTFVLCLGVVVDAVMVHGLDNAMRDVLPAGDSLAALLGTRPRPQCWPTLSTTCRPFWCCCHWSQRRRPADARGADRREHRPQLDLRGFTGKPIVAERGSSKGIEPTTQTTRGSGFFHIPLTFVTSVLGLWCRLQLFYR